VKFTKCSVVLALMATPVYPADLPLVSAKPVVAPLRAIPVYNWTGFYAGAMFGWGFGRDSINLSGNGPDEAAAIANGLVPSRLSTTRNDWLAGATLGYNYQFGRMVFGLETDYAGTGFSGSHSFSNSGCQNFNGLGTGGRNCPGEC
jgi:outer membrane immunogenic protein